MARTAALPPKNDKIEPAKTGRSSCTECKAAIDKDEIRLGIAKKSSTGFQDQWYHSKCYLKFKKNFEKDVEEMIGYDNLSKTQQASIKKQFAQAKKNFKENTTTNTTTATKSTTKAAAAAKPAPVAAKTSARQATKAADTKVEKKSGGKYGGYTAAELKAFKEHLEEINDNSVAELKALLKKNGVTQSGNRDELINRVADCKTLGTLPNCLKCGGGRLKYRQDNGSYFCKGYMDDSDFVNCSATYAKNEVSRGTWVD